MRLSTTTFLQVFREVCDSLVHHGFENLIAVNGHGGNIAALTVAINHYFETTGRRVFLVQWWDLASDVLADVEGPMIHAEEAETSLALALGQTVYEERATRDAYDRGAAVKEAGLPWTSFGRYEMRARGPGVIVPMDMLRDITESGVVGDATKARRETGEKMLSVLIPASSRSARNWPERSNHGAPRDRPLAAALPRVAAAPVLPADADPPAHPAHGRGPRPAVVQRRDHHHLEPRGHARGRVRPLRPERSDDRRDAARHVLRRRALRRHPRLPEGPRRHRGRGRAGGRGLRARSCARATSCSSAPTTTTGRPGRPRSSTASTASPPRPCTGWPTGA